MYTQIEKKKERNAFVLCPSQLCSEPVGTLVLETGSFISRPYIRKSTSPDVSAVLLCDVGLPLLYYYSILIPGEHLRTCDWASRRFHVR
jgi:hypothetical protein